MKIQSPGLLQQLSKTEIVVLTTEVKEVLATGFNKSNKIFSAAELWNIQRQVKPRVQRRYN